ncbi:hypothetical protein [Rhizobium leguminosarum]|uniref:Uncharacterized protein n=1 Tax=Rhizobium leguminosarum TaxID=384 RepID=A0A2K9Z2A9_RHILE|nr:hypothetical protein [Rhizobium leguminosarum]AUW42384.1 hypothetical protein CUJ84_Chr002016 [Rhizobium leguminosarum]
MSCHIFKKPSGTRLRLWLDQAPPSMDSTRCHLWESKVFVSGEGTPHRKSVAAEIARPVGGLTVYGLLSVTLDQSIKTQGLQVNVPIERTKGESWSLSLAPSYDKVLTGFAAEYIPGLFKGIEDLSEGALPSFGILSFDRMAHSDIGSSIDIFRELTRAIVRALAMKQVPETPDEAFALLEA